MKKTFKFEKDIYVYVELTDNGVFTASASTPHMGGQILDELKEIIKDERFDTIYAMWEKHHLNDLHPGTEAQEKMLLDNGYNNWANNYKDCCEFLKSKNLLIDNGYKFGSGWLKREIPTEDLEIIKNLLK